MKAATQLKNVFLRSLMVPGIVAPLASLTRRRAAIFMLHRFQCPEEGIPGHEPDALRQSLEYLRRHRYELVSIHDVFTRLGGEGPPLHKAVAFTIDDGYFDHAEIGAPVFAEFDCPVTTFVTTGFLDRALWFWWDKIEYVFHNTTLDDLAIEIGGTPHRYRWQHDGERAQALADFTLRCKHVPDDDKHAAIAGLASAAEVELPGEAPRRYAPMTWDQLRGCESGGMTFGPHTITHPVLARTTDEQSRRELTGSWNRLKEEAGQPVPVFCYPNGRFEDFSDREVATLKEIGMLGAVVGAPGGGPDATTFQRSAAERFRVRRYVYPRELPQLVQFVSGFDRLKRILRNDKPS